MHGWNNKSIIQRQSSSFSSSLLDEIYHSMDAGDYKPSEFKLHEDILSRKHRVSGGGGDSDRARASSMEDDGYDSEPVSFRELRSRKPSCFSPFRSKQVKANVSLRKHQHMNSDYCLNNNHTNSIFHGPFFKSKAQALKIYTNLKKVKQPISPGGRFTSFLNNILTNRHFKKPKDLKDQNIERISKSTHGSTCSSPSFTKSCLSKNSPRSREKINNGIRRTVRFYPVSVIIDEDCRPCGEKFIYKEQDFMNVHEATMMSKNQFNNDEEVNDHNDMASDVSSDLFELDHLSILQECYELPIFETTLFDNKHAVVDRLTC